MLKYILKRIGLSIIILLGVSLILYILVRCMPTKFIDQKIAQINQGGAQVTDEMIQNMRQMYGLTDETFVGYLKGYGSWLWNLAKLNLGDSFIEGLPVMQVIVNHMGISFAVAFIAIIFEYLIAIPLGITAATHQYAIRDYVVTVLVVLGLSLPSFFFARALQSLVYNWTGFYSSGLVENGYETGFNLIFTAMKFMALPLISIILLGVGGTVRYTRTNMLDVLNADYIRTARAKGLSEGKVIYKHAFRNTMIPIVTMLAGVLPSLFSGAMITEQIFDLPGIGNVALKCMTAGDIPFIMGYNMFLAFLSVIGVLLSDLMYMVVDPRVKLA